MKCKGSARCPACRHPCRKVRNVISEIALCRCCEAYLTPRELDLFRFYGSWRHKDRRLSVRLNRYKPWSNFCDALVQLVRSLRSTALVGDDDELARDMLAGIRPKETGP